MSAPHIGVAERKWGYRPVHHVFELVFVGMAALVAVPLVVGVIPAPDTTASFLPPALLKVWGWMLLAGAALALVGLLWAGRVITGLVLEQVGLIVLAGAVLLYVGGTVRNLSSNAAVPVAIVCAFGVACLLRSVQLRQEVKDLVISAVTDGRSSGEQDVRDHLQRKDEEASG